MSYNYFFPAEILKSGKEDNGRIPITIVPNSPSPDRANDKILLKAFSEKCINDYISNSGIIDYDHQSILGKDDLEKSGAIIGEAEKIYIDKKNNVPKCEGFLFKNNPIVRESILPALEAKSKVYGASVGGKILKKSTEIDPDTKKNLNIISEISLNHIAITPRAKAVNPDTIVELRKSLNNDKLNETNFYFSDFNSFIKSFQDCDFLYKTLIAGNATDISGISGGQTLQSQSLEGAKLNKNKIKTILPFIIDGILGQYQNKKNYKDWMKYLNSKGFTSHESITIIQLLAKNKNKIVKLI